MGPISGPSLEDPHLGCRCSGCGKVNLVRYDRLRYSMYPGLIPGELREDLAEATICFFGLPPLLPAKQVVLPGSVCSRDTALLL